MLSGLAGPRPSSKLRYFVLEVLVEEMPFHGNFSHIVNVFGKTSTEKKTFSFGHCPNKGGGLPMLEIFGPLFKSAFLVNKRSLKPKCQ